MIPNFYDRFVLPLVLDVVCTGRPIRRQREKVIGLARGDVLEIGIGTGLNMPTDRHFNHMGPSIAPWNRLQSA